MLHLAGLTEMHVHKLFTKSVTGETTEISATRRFCNL